MGEKYGALEGMGDMKISVIMLTYNRENFISKAIESILRQTEMDYEFIIVNNGSIDKSGEIAEMYAKIDNRIKVIHIPKSGIGKGRNTGLSLAKGDFITFVDDDDIAEYDMLEFLYNLAVENEADISICGSNKKVEGEILPNCIFDEYLDMTPSEAVIELLKRKKINAAMPTKMIKKHLFDRIRFNETGKYDDISVTYKYMANARKVVANGLPKYCFIRHEKNNSSFTTNDMLLTPEQLNEYFSAFRERTIYLSKILPDISEYAQYSEWSYMISMCNKIVSNNLTNCSKQLEYVKRELSKHYDEFYFGKYIEEFEKVFMRKYISKSYYGEYYA
ncbi:glycosyltransferase family 2 protein [Sedimentibacter sp.]|uniref:glycosyltransferase family 2 protein n=1 Tax=Sedimentibacter sp. TaxID=1960295 RepID=UPI00289A4CB6|nr:glycosyltransferase family 2 protein [Sedimentibacter sp.]